MNDLEICKRIAEIEEYTFEVIKIHDSMSAVKPTEFINVHEYPNVGCSMTYNPLTDDALFFVLQNKYEVCVHYGSGDVFICGGDNFDGCLSVKSFDVDDKKTLNKAICLAIIEAHKEQS